MTNLTDRQRELLGIIVESGENTPSFRELTKRMRVKSPSGVFRHLLALEKKGFIKRLHEGMSRGTSRQQVQVLRLPAEVEAQFVLDRVRAALRGDGADADVLSAARAAAGITPSRRRP